MLSTKPKILCTGPVEISADLRDAADIDVVPFTSITYSLTPAAEKQTQILLKKKANVVFTSSNSIRAIEATLSDAQPDWMIYCIGNTTKKTAEKYFNKDHIKQTASHAKALAEKITGNGAVDNVTFFCGNLRRDDLPAALREKNIAVDEIEVYQTSLTPVSIEKDYDAILFFSPSAVQSFFSVNIPAQRAVLFVIGQTTATQLAPKLTNKIIVAVEPDKTALVRKAVQFTLQNVLLR
jgi:uroporphyrinogen-III synthase